MTATPVPMTAPQTDPTEKRSSLFPWRHVQSEQHPALKAAHDGRTLGERVADRIASFGGSWPFIFIFLGLIVGWMIANTLIIGHLANGKAFDPYPYIALNLVLSGLAGIQAPIIMMSQNRQAKIADRRNQLDLQINLLAEQESTETLRLLRRLCEHSGVDMRPKSSTQGLEADTHPEEVVSLLEKAIKRPPKH
jgi:uncharacterized membrane protein